MRYDRQVDIPSEAKPDLRRIKDTSRDAGLSVRRSLDRVSPG
jgi:hypothetical protein